MIELYPAKNHDRLNGQPFAPELVTGTAMVNPHYRSVTLPPGIRTISDSGAFQEVKPEDRVTPAAALDRQLAFETATTPEGCRRFPSGFEAIVSYDQLLGVDEAVVERAGKRVVVKRRGTEATAAPAVAATIASAEHYHRERDRVAGAIAYAAQGATLRQYVGCVRALLDMIRPGRDWLALGGFCIVGIMTTLKPLFVEICRTVAPMLRRAGVRRAHVLGVFCDDALTAAGAAFAAVGVRFSTDTSGVERQSIMGRVWSAENMARWPGASPWAQVYGVDDKQVLYHPATLTIDNITRAETWLRTACDGRKPIPPFQRSLDDLEVA